MDKLLTSTIDELKELEKTEKENICSVTESEEFDILAKYVERMLPKR